MGNTKSYTFATPVCPGDQLPTLDQLRDWARSDYVICGEIRQGTPDHAFIVHACSESQVADQLIEQLVKRFPYRWAHVTRYDADWSDFRVICIDENNATETTIADNWHSPKAN